MGATELAAGFRPLGELDLGHVAYPIFMVAQPLPDSVIKALCRNAVRPQLPDTDYPDAKTPADLLRAQVTRVVEARDRGICSYWAHCIFITCRTPSQLMARTLAHEIAHAYLFESNLCADWNHEKTEWAAELLASVMVPLALEFLTS